MKSTIIKYLTVTVLWSIVLSGCNSLEQGPKNKYTDDNFWESTERVQLLANMAYRQMYEFGWWWTDEALSDNMIEMRGTPDTRVIRMGQATPNLNLFREHWENIFKGIKSTNVILDKVHLVPDMQESYRERLTAEMRFIRAFIFFRISNFWGDIPFFLHDITLEESYSVTRTPRATVIAELLKEMDEIIPVLPTRNQISASENGRISKGAAMMLKARMHMQVGDYVNAERCLEALIDDQATYGTYDLFNTSWTDPEGNFYSAYECLFHSKNEYNEEIILDYSAVHTLREWDELSKMVPRDIGTTGLGADYTTKTPTQSLVDSYLMLSGHRIDEAGSGYSESNPYVNRDPRLDATIVYNGFVWKYKHPTAGTYGTEVIDTQAEYNKGENYTRTGYYTRKWYDPDAREEYKNHNNPIIMRYAETLLSYAEAYHENHGMTEEVWNKTIRPIRLRAGFNTPKALDFDPTLTADEMREVIRNERRVELALEGHRYWDILRWDIGSEVLTGTVYGARFYSGNTYIPLANYKYTDRDKLWAIPQVELDNVPTLRPNNPGY
ncbi:MAG: RagB/SusD family nutrient uptake outer membrane protein [Rikenellaceae bacterium]|nr:RagB/SusD family nutrient uptake outer membrane protein [Rikenellaceae bacterium]